VGTKTKAVLIHYSRLKPRIPTTIPLDRDVFLAVQKLDRKLFDARMLLDRLPASRREARTNELKDLRSAIETALPHDLDCTLDYLAPLTQEFDAWLSRATTTAEDLVLWRKLRWAEVVKCHTIAGFPPMRGKRVVGYQCTSNHDSSRGGLYVDQGDLLHDEIGFRAHSQRDRGFDWDIRIWVAPAEELDFAESDA
jgi:hypothetical protein